MADGRLDRWERGANRVLTFLFSWLLRFLGIAVTVRMVVTGQFPLEGLIFAGVCFTGAVTTDVIVAIIKAWRGAEK